MNKVKGTGLATLKNYLTNYRDIENQLLAALPSRISDIYKRALSVSMISVDAIMQIYQTAADIIYPNDKKGIQQIGYLIAIDNLKGIYSILMRITSIPYAVKKSSQMWQTYNETGKGYIEQLPNPKQFLFCVKDYPDLLDAYKLFMCGYLTGVLEVAGAKNIEVTARMDFDQTRNAWTWLIKWN